MFILQVKVTGKKSFNFEIKIAVAEKKKEEREKKSGIFIYWVCTHWLGAML